MASAIGGHVKALERVAPNLCAKSPTRTILCAHLREEQP